MVSSFSFLPEFQADKIEAGTGPRLAVGVASPLWLMFGGAAAAGAAYWWWASRWREAVNLEAMLALAPEPVAPPIEAETVLEAAPEPVVEAVALAVETAEAVIDATEDAVEAVAEAALDAVEPANDATLEVIEAAAEAAPRVPLETAALETAPDPIAESAEVAEAGVDDLTRLVGVGPKLATSLAELGVTTFGQIAAWTPEELAEIDLKLGLKGRAERDAWIAQAKRFAAGVEGASV